MINNDGANELEITFYIRNNATFFGTATEYLGQDQSTAGNDFDQNDSVYFSSVFRVTTVPTLFWVGSLYSLPADPPTTIQFTTPNVIVTRISN